MPSLKKGVKAILDKYRRKKEPIFIDQFGKVTEFPAVAVYDFTTSAKDELPFKCGDIILLSSPLLENCWMDALNFRTQKTGRVPTSFLADEYGESQTLDALQFTGRMDAEHQLLLPVVELGTFILRFNQTCSSLALSVLREEGSQRRVDHWRVQYDAQDETYFVIEKEKFSSLDMMISAYQNPSNESSLVLLTKPYPKPNKNDETFSNCMISRESINLITKIGEGNFGEVWKAECRGVMVAAKLALVGTAQKDMAKEAATMSKLIYPRLVRFLGISDGMKYIEDIGAVHNDLRSANVLVASDGSVKVADFGLSKILHNDSRDKCCRYQNRSVSDPLDGNRINKH
ncbi:hypothetical protein ACTXT7_001157 [Hymenolepis weldensis]